MRKLNLVFLVFAALVSLAGCGDDGSDNEKTRAHVEASAELRDALENGACPPRNLVLRSGQTFSPRTVALAREQNRFSVHTEDLELAPPVDWLQDPYASKAFRGRLADLDWTAVLFYAYRQGDLKALRQAKDLIFDWIAEQPRGGAGTSDQAWQDKTIGDRVLHIAYLARAGACEGLLSGAELDTLAESIAEHADALTDPRVYVPTNHGLYMDLALALLSQQLPGPEADDWAELAVKRYARTFGRRIFEKEGFWLEHSAGYQVLLTNLLAKSLETPGFESPELEDVLGQMREASGWLAMPDGQIPQFGHSDLTRAPQFDEADDDRGLFFAPKTGWAVVKEPGAYLSVTAMFHNTSHKQADDLSFDLFDGGLRVLSDTGLYNKDRNDYYEFAQSAQAHSTLTVDGETFPLEEDDAYGGGLQAAGEGDGWYAILGHNPLLAQSGVKHSRLFLYRPGEALVVADSVRSDADHAYDRYFQLGPEVDARVPSGVTVLGSAGEEPAPVKLSGPEFSGSVTSTASVGDQRLEEIRGETDPLGGFTFPSFRERIARSTLEYSSQAGDADYGVAFDLGGSGLQARVESFEPAAIELNLHRRGAAPLRVEVTRDHKQLTVSEDAG